MSLAIYWAEPNIGLAYLYCAVARTIPGSTTTQSPINWASHLGLLRNPIGSALIDLGLSGCFARTIQIAWGLISPEGL